MKSDSKPIQFLIGRDKGYRCLCDEKVNAWWYIDFRNVKIRPTNYTLRHYTSWNIEALAKWQFQGSDDGETWTTIKEHINDDSLKEKDGSYTWDIENCPTFIDILEFI